MKLPRDFSGGDVVKALGRLGFEVVRQQGSHLHRIRGACAVPVPNHRVLVPKTLPGILRQAGVTVDLLRESP